MPKQRKLPRQVRCPVCHRLVQKDKFGEHYSGHTTKGNATNALSPVGYFAADAGAKFHAYECRFVKYSRTRSTEEMARRQAYTACECCLSNLKEQSRWSEVNDFSPSNTGMWLDRATG